MALGISLLVLLVDCSDLWYYHGGLLYKELAGFLRCGSGGDGGVYGSVFGLASMVVRNQDGCPA